MSQPETTARLYRRLLALVLLGYSLTAGADSAPQTLTTEARGRVQAFATQLKQALQQSIETGGLPAAIATCQTVAPTIAGQHSDDGWRIGRTALRLRNPDNRPDSWERQVLQDFQRRLQAGEAASGLEISKIEDGQFRYMKAIPTAPMCTGCHGNDLAEPVRQRLEALYPEDNATGFAAGSLRGAFTVTRPWPEA